ncbi:MAG: alpha/beta fold hydrolase [Salinigranum sp.]
MTLRRVLGAAAAGIGILTASNRVLATRAGELQPPLSGDRRTLRWRGMDVSYVEDGDPDDPDLLLLHGMSAAGSAGSYREVFSELARDYHVVAPDFPGFGLSDRPPLSYSAALYEDFVADFIAEFDAPSVVASGLTGAYVATALREDTGAAVSGLVLVCPTTTAGPDRIGALRDLLRLPLVGTALFNLLVSKPGIRYFNADHGYYDVSKLTDEWVDYEWRSAHQPNARFAPASLISGFLNSEEDLGAALAELDVPTTLVWGREADVTPLSDGRAIADEADARLIVLDDTKLQPYVEFPEEFVETVRSELSRATA